MRWCVQDRHDSDEALVVMAQAGDAAAEERLLNRYKSAVRARARKFFLAGGETDDLVQEGMIGLFAAVHAFRADGGKSFKNFAYLCVSRRIYSALRTAERQVESGEVDPESIPGANTPEGLLLEEEALAELRRRLMRVLTDLEFRVFSLWLDGASYADISRATGKPVKSIDNALARSRKKLQTALPEERNKENA